MTLFVALVWPGALMAAQSMPNPDVAKALGAVLEGDGRKALRLLSGLPRAGLSERDERFRLCAPARLQSLQPITPAEVSDSFTRQVLGAYRGYWRSAVLTPGQRASAEQALLRKLSALLGGPKLPDLDSAELLVSGRLKAAGYHSLGGRTGPLRELMIWSDQTDRTYHVSLPGGVQTTRVVLLDGFISRGWGGYLTCDRSGTGGWATKEGLFAVVPSYENLEDENFQVNFLAHEAQHFADYAQFPNLEGWELEYRAKLVELSRVVITRDRVLARFKTQQSDDPASPHGYANKRVLSALRQRLGLRSEAELSGVSTARLQEAASAELVADTARLEARRVVKPADVVPGA
jgi:hypothetical protein